MGVSGGSTDNYLLTGLQNEATSLHHIIVGTSEHFFSDISSQTTDLPTNILQALFDVVLKCNIFRFKNSILHSNTGDSHGDEDGSLLC